MNKRVDFDKYADQYEHLLKDQLAFFSKDREYFSEYKVQLAANRMGTMVPKNILDFGCGIGLSLPYLNKYFPHSKIFATDTSQKSLEYVKEKYINAQVLYDREIDAYKFDMIFITGVFHHVPINLRSDIVNRLSNLLSQKGKIIVFEHNPFNLVTRHMVSTCPFDEDAILISQRKMKCLLNASSNLKVIEQGYCLFFPQFLKGMRSLESALRWLPLGGQYFSVATN